MDHSSTHLLCEAQDDESLDTDDSAKSTDPRTNPCCCRLPGKEAMAGRVSVISSSAIVVWMLSQCMVIIRKFWAVATSGLLILLLIFWLYGSLVALSLFLLAVIGKFLLSTPPPLQSTQ